MGTSSSSEIERSWYNARYDSVRSWWVRLGPSKQAQYTRLIGIAVVLIYMAIVKSFMMLRPDHFFLAMFIFILFMGEKRDFLVHWGPFVLFWVSYDMLRGIADNLAGRVNVENVYNAEVSVVGWMFDGDIPAFIFQQYKYDHTGEFHVKAITFLCGAFYGNHFTSAILLAWLLYWKVEDKYLFRQYVFTFIATSYAALVTFYLFPAAPPWYVYQGYQDSGEYNFAQPKIEDWDVSAAGLIDIDKATGVGVFGTLYKTFNSNPYAAVPSLHAAYSVSIAIFVHKRYGKKGAVMWIWPVGMWFSSQWLNHHYVIDLLLGSIYLAVFYTIAIKIFKPKSDKSAKTPKTTPSDASSDQIIENKHEEQASLKLQDTNDDEDGGGKEEEKPEKDPPPNLEAQDTEDD